MLKLMLALSLMLGTQSAFALGGKGAYDLRPTDSWETIQRVPGVIAEFPQINFGSYFMPVANVCVKGDQLRTARPVDVCVAWSNGDGENSPSCVAYKSEHLYTARAFTREICKSWTGGESSECTAWETISGVHALSYDVPVSFEQGSESSRQQLFTKRLDIGACN